MIAGNAELDVDRCLVSWMPTLEALREAEARRVRLLISHEPTFWNHRDDGPVEDPKSRAKHRFIRDRGIAIARIHDCWDRWLRIGIPWAWAQFLGLGREPAAIHEKGMQHRYEEIGCDCSIVCDDGSCYWSNIQRARDSGHPVIRVNHGTSEEPGMVTLTKYINENIEGIRAEHLPHGSCFRLVGAEFRPERDRYRRAKDCGEYRG